MAIARDKSKDSVSLNLSPMIDVVFLILIYFIVSMQMEPSLDNIIKLPPVLRASKQEDALLQIYVLPAKIRADGSVVDDSTGLIAFSDKAKTPDTCSNGHRILDKETQNYIPNSLTDVNGVPIADLQKAKARAFKENAPPPIFLCATCGAEVGPYVKLQDVPAVIKEKKAEVFDLMLANRNARRRNEGKDPLSPEEEKQLEDGIALMIKADEKTFYGRILQVVNFAKSEEAGIKNFAFVTDPKSSADVQEKMNPVQGGEQ